MSPKIQKIALGAGLAVLAVSIQAFVYLTMVAPKKDTASDLRAMTDTIRTERAQRAAAVRDAETASLPALRTGAMTVPQLLARVQEIAVNSSVHLHAIEPAEPGSDVFSMTMAASYENAVRFLARFESLRVEISELEMTGLTARNGGTAANEATRDWLLVTIGFRQTQDPPAVGLAEAAAFETRLREAPLRNPFADWGGAMSWRPAAGSNDLTWVHHLTGVSQIGEQRIATINDRDYRVGDRLDGLVISAINDDSVTLSSGRENGEDAYRLSFRYALADRS